MKKLFSLIAFLLILSGTTSYAQYSASPNNEFISLLSESFMHGVPDSIHNHLDYPLKVEVKREDTGKKYPGLQYNTSPTDITYVDILNPSEGMAVNRNRFRSSASDPQKKQIELIITIPKELVDPVWGISQSVKWRLGDGHEPSYTTIKKIKKTGEVQVTITYTEGVPPNTPREKNLINNNPQYIIKHVQSHWCHPLDTSPFCTS